MQSIDIRMEEIKRIKNDIDRDVKTEFGSIADRLKSAEGTKIAMLM